MSLRIRVLTRQRRRFSQSCRRRRRRGGCGNWAAPRSARTPRTLPPNARRSGPAADVLVDGPYPDRSSRDTDAAPMFRQATSATYVAQDEGRPSRLRCRRDERGQMSLIPGSSTRSKSRWSPLAASATRAAWPRVLAPARRRSVDLSQVPGSADFSAWAAALGASRPRHDVSRASAAGTQRRHRFYPRRGSARGAVARALSRSARADGRHAGRGGASRGPEPHAGLGGAIDAARPRRAGRALGARDLAGGGGAVGAVAGN